MAELILTEELSRECYFLINMILGIAINLSKNLLADSKLTAKLTDCQNLIDKRVKVNK